VEATRRPGSPTYIEAARASGDEAGYLREALRRIDAIAGLLSAAALGHVGAGDLADSLAVIIQIVDRAARYVEQAGGER
jgi:hypothetical protein